MSKQKRQVKDTRGCLLLVAIFYIGLNLAARLMEFIARAMIFGMGITLMFTIGLTFFVAPMILGINLSSQDMWFIQGISILTGLGFIGLGYWLAWAFITGQWFSDTFAPTVLDIILAENEHSLRRMFNIKPKGDTIIHPDIEYENRDYHRLVDMEVGRDMDMGELASKQSLMVTD